MADSSETRALLLQINATTELLRSELSAAEKATADFQAGVEGHLGKVDERFDLLGKSVEKLEAPLERLKGLGESAIGLLLGESLIETGKKALEFAGNVQFVSEQVGTSTDFLQKYRYAAGQFGVATAAADEGLGKFARSVGQAGNGNKSLIELFDRLGVKVLDSNSKVRSVEGVYLDTADAIKKLDNPAQKAADTMALLGKQSLGLVPLLSAGSDGFNALASAAEQLGIVLSPELIEHSEQVNHKLAALKQVVDAQMASAIAQNATAIESLATSMVAASGAVAKFLSGHPERALGILGAMAGSRLGYVGALVGGVAGYVYGEQLGQQEEDSNTDPAFRKQKLLEARKRYDRDKSAPVYTGRAVTLRDGNTQGSQTDIPAAIAEMQRQIGLTQAALAAPHSSEGHGLGSGGVGSTNDNGDGLKNLQTEVADLEKQKVGASGAVLAAYNDEIANKKRQISFIKQGATAEMATALAGKEGAAQRKSESEARAAAAKAEAERLKKLTEDAAFQGEIRTADAALAKAKEALSDTAEGQLAIDIQSLRDAEKTREVQLDLQVAAGKRTGAQRAQLETTYRETETDEEILAKRKEVARLADEALARENLSLQGKINLASLDDQLALTRKERLKLELQLLDYQEKQAIAAQNDIIAKSQPNSEAAKNAHTTIDQINAQHPANVALVERKNETPLASYRDQLKSAVGDTNDALQGVGVDAFKSLEDGFAGVISGTKSVGAAFKDMASSIVADLAKILIEKTILSAISGGSIFGIHFADGGQAVQHKAGGGPIYGAGGPREDKIPAMLSNGEYVINAAAYAEHPELVEAINHRRLPRFADGGLVSPSMSLQSPQIPRMPSFGAMSRQDRVHVTADVNVKPSPLFVTEIQQNTVRTVGAMAEPIMAGAQERTIRKINRPSLPGGYG